MAERISKRRQRIFMLLAFLLPFLILALTEAGLRVSGFGHSYPLFVEVEQAPGYLWANRQVVRRFMVDESDTPTHLRIRPVPFSRQKAPGTFRIFIVGSSTAAGYPYYSLMPMLRQRLQSTFPERRIEVVTTAMGAVNSYTFLDFTDEIIEQRPDAVLIYAGQNEYVGILGVASGYSAGRYRPMVLAFLWLRDLRLFQLMQRLVSGLKPDTERIYHQGRTLLALVVKDREIPLGSDLYQRGIEQYRANLNAILSRYQRAGVSVLIGTLFSNERDQPPFISRHAPQTDGQALQHHLDAGRKLLDSGRASEALVEFDKAVALDDIVAESYYERAQALDRLGRFAEAREAYLAAKDRDQLRFRAPEALNQVIREAASKHGAHLVDVQQALADAARDGIIGDDLMVEHVHPNVRGYFLMADAYYEAFRDLGMIGPWTNAVSQAQAWETIPVTELDRIYGEWRIKNLKSDWPFKEQKMRFYPEAHSALEKIAVPYFYGRIQWPTAMRELLDHYRREGNLAEAAKVAVLLADAFPYRLTDQMAAYELLDRTGRPEASIYLRRAQKEYSATSAGH
jgi:tetratricopeptide (TPR) repeat protein